MTTVMKSLVYRNGVVRFRIPLHWREEYSDIDGGTFYEDGPDSGALRMKIITLSTDEILHSGSARDILKVVEGGLKDEGVQGTVKDRKDGNALFKYEEAGRERGTRLTIFYWVVANPLPPHHARIITFSYTVLAKRRDDIATQRELEMLEEEIESATFSTELGAIPD
jgi:hypothetical protein